jgi:hypothetical protein
LEALDRGFDEVGRELHHMVGFIDPGSSVFEGVT